MNHAQQTACAGHVDAVVVARAEVDGGEVTILKLCCQLRIATHQCLRGVRVSFGLKNLIALNASELTDCTIYGADPF